jgi:putative resolvase
MKLSQYARKLGVTYRTAWEMYKRGDIPKAYTLKSGTIIVPDESSENSNDFTVVYARVSSSENKSNLISQSKRVQDFCAAKGWVVSKVVEECASGMESHLLKQIDGFQVLKRVLNVGL